MHNDAVRVYPAENVTNTEIVPKGPTFCMTYQSAHAK